MKTREENKRDRRNVWYCVAFFCVISVACILPDILTAVGL